MFKPHTMIKKVADDLRRAITTIYASFSWSLTEEGYEFWSEVVKSLEKKVSHRTSDGHPQTAEKAPREIIHLDGVPYEIPDGWQWRLDDLDTGAEEVAEDAPRDIVYIDGVPYDVPDERDIGKLAWVSNRPLDSACLARLRRRIADYRPDDGSPYVSESGSEWKYAVLVPKEDGNGNGYPPNPYIPPENKEDKMNNPNPKTKAILDQVRILVQTYPNFVYSYDGDKDFPCQYNTGGDSKYPGLCGCIIGQAARLAGIDTSDWDEIPGDTVIFTRIEDRLGEDNESPEARILLHIQVLQDSGVPWGKAYDEACKLQNRLKELN